MHVLVLFFLYILQVEPIDKAELTKESFLRRELFPTFFFQGIPLGLIHSVPLVLGKKEVKKIIKTIILHIAYCCSAICTVSTITLTGIISTIISNINITIDIKGKIHSTSCKTAMH